MKTFSDLSEGEKDKFNENIDAVSSLHESLISSKKLGPKKFGICSDCSRFGFAETEFKVIYAKCIKFSIERLDTQAVTNCSFYDHKGQMDIWSMKEIAILIDTPKMKVGFDTGEKK